MNRLIIKGKDGLFRFYDLDIKFPDDIKLGSYSITIPNTPEMSEAFVSGSFDAELECLLNYDENAGSIYGKVVVTSRTPDSITFNFIRIDSGTIHKYVSDGKTYDLRLPTIDSGLSAFPDAKVSTIGTYKAYDFTSDAQGELTWRNIYGLKTSPREEPIEKFAADHTSVWADVDPVTACNPLGDACTANYSFRYDGDASYRFGGQNRLMTTRLVKFTCLETGFYDMNVGNIDLQVDNHMSVYLPDSKVLNISSSMYTIPSVDLAIIEDDKFDELKDDFILYPKQESYISVKPEQSMDGEVKDLFNKLLRNSPTYPYDPGSTDNPYIGMPTGYTVGVESDLFSLSRVTWKDSYIDNMDAKSIMGVPSNKGGVVAAYRLGWSGYIESSEQKSYGILPCDVRGMMCTGMKDKYLKMVPLYDGSFRKTFSSNAPFPEKVAADAPKYRIYFGNRLVRLGNNSYVIHNYPSLQKSYLKFSTKDNKINSRVITEGKFGTVFLEAGKTYSLVVQVSSCPVMVMLNGRKELRYMFPKELRTDYDKILDEVTFNRSVLNQNDFIINPSPYDVGVGKLSELPVVDSLDGSFWNTADAGNTRFNTISLNPKGDYYDFARGLRGSNENKLIDIRAYNKFMFDTILTMDFKVTVSTSLNEFSLGVRDVDGVYKDILISDFIGGYDGVNPVTLYNGGFISLYSPSIDISTPMLNGITKSKMEFAVRNTTEDEDDNTIDNAFEDTHTLRFSRNATPQYYYDFLSLNHDTAKEINNYIEVENFPCQFRTDAGTWVTVCSSNIVDVLNIDTVKETCTVRFYLPTAGYLL